MTQNNNNNSFFKNWFDRRASQKQNRQIDRKRQNRRLQLESLEERALLSVTCGSETTDLFISDAICSNDFCSSCLCDFPCDSESTRQADILKPIAADSIKQSVIVPEVNDQMNLPLATEPTTVNVSDHFGEGITTISFTQFKTLISKAGNGGTVVFDKDIAIEFSAGDSYFYISSSITFSNTGGYDVTFDGKNEQAFFLISNNATATFDGIKFINGNGTFTGQTSAGGAFWNSAGTLNLNNCQINDISFEKNGAICNYSTCNISNCSLTNCSTTASGGAIYSSGSCTLTNSTITNCSASNSGGAIYIYSSGSCTLTNSTITNCSASKSGGAIYIYSTGSCTITNSIIKNCSVTGSNSFGGAITNYGTFYLIGSALYGNSAADGNGGAIVGFDDSGNIFIINSTIAGNFDKSISGGIYAYSGITLYNSILVMNYSNGTANDFYNHSGSVNTYSSLYSAGQCGTATNLTETNKLTVSNVETGIFVAPPLFGNGKTSKITNINDVDLALQNTCTELIDKGTDLATIYTTLGLTDKLTIPTTDLAKNARCIGSAIDIGAYENMGTLQKLGTPSVSLVRKLYNSIRLSWSANINAGSYNVFYKKSEDSTFSLFGNFTDTSVTVSSLDGNTSYDFCVTAIPSDTTIYAESDPSTTLTCSTTESPETPWTTSYAPQLSTSGPTVSINWTDSGADKIYLQYYYTNSEVDTSGASDTSGNRVITPYTSDVTQIEVQNETDHSYEINLIYGSKLFVKMWDSTLNESETSYSSIDVLASNQNTKITVEGQLVDVLNLASKPDSKRIIYLDFTGHITVGTYWNTNAAINKDTIISPIFSLDGSNVYSQNELEAIYKIWLSISEDYSIFDINVTTIFPGFENLLNNESITDDTFGIRVVIGGDSSIINKNCGGIAYVDSFGYSLNNGSETPCFIFPDDLALNPGSVAEAASHEVGHTLGLHHRSGGSFYSGEYSYGITSSNGVFSENNNYSQNWATVMGAGYYSDLTQWSDGSYYNAILPFGAALNSNGTVREYYIKDDNNTYIPIDKYISSYFTNTQCTSTNTGQVSYPDDLKFLTNNIFYKSESSENTYTNLGGGYLSFRNDDYTATFSGGVIDSGTYGMFTLDNDDTIDTTACQKTIGYTTMDDQNHETVTGLTYNGIINSENDTDVFVLTTDSFLKSITFTIKGVSYGSESYSNLPIYAYLYKKDESNALVSLDTVYTTAMSVQGVTITYDQGIASGTTLYLVIDGGEVLLNNDGYTSDYGSLGYYTISGSTQSGVSVTQNLTNMTSTFTGTILSENNFETTLTPSSGYSLPETLTITVGGTDLTTSQYSYSSETGELSISSEYISDNIVINATATLNNYTISTTFTNGTYSGVTSGTITSNDLTITLTPNDSYQLPSAINVMIGGNSASLNTDYIYNSTTGVVTLISGKITGNVVISATAVQKTEIAFTTTLTASALSTSQIDLSFSVNDNSASITIYYSLTGTENSWIDIPTSSDTGIYCNNNNNNYSVYNLSPGTSYYFKVSASSNSSSETFFGTVISQTGPVSTLKGTISGVMATAYSKEYDGLAHGISFTGLETNDTVTYSSSETGLFSNDVIEYTNVTNGAQTVWYKISRTGYNDFTGSSTINISAAQIDVSFNGTNDNYIYSASEQGSKITATATGVHNEILTLSVIFKGTDGAAKDQTEFRNAGYYDLTASLISVSGGEASISNYALRNTTSSAQIQKADLLVTATDYNGAYNGQTHYISITTFGVNNESLTTDIYYDDAALTSENYRDNGSTTLISNETQFVNFTDGDKTVYYYIIANSDNYNTATGFGTVKITKATAQVSFTGTNDNYIYSGVDQGSKITATAAGVNNEILTLSTAFTGFEGAALNQTIFKNAGKYNLAASLISVSNGEAMTSNYELEDTTSTATINKATLTADTTNYENAYDGNDHSIGVTVAGVKNDLLDTNIYYSNVEITNQNYSTGSTALETDKTQFINFTNTEQTVYYYVADNSGNYNGVAGSGTVNITKAQTTVTFNGTTAIYSYNGESHAESVSASADGINGESLVFSITFTGTNGAATGQTSFQNAGSYKLIANLTSVTGGQALTANYQLNNAESTANIEKADLTVDVTNYMKTYDEHAHSIIVNVSGISTESPTTNIYYSNEELTKENYLSKGSLVLINDKTNFTNFTNGDKTVYCYVTESLGNYNDVVRFGKVNITKAVRSVTFSGTDNIYTYDRTDHNGSVAASIMNINNEEQFLSIRFQGTSGAATGQTAFKNAGDYSISAFFNDQTMADNYDLQNATSSSSINSKLLGVNGTNVKKVYDETGTIKIEDRSLSGIIGNDVVTLDSNTMYDTSSANIGEYQVALRLTGADADNYKAVQSVQIIPQTPVFSKNSYSVQTQADLLLTSNGEEIPGTDPNQVIYSWSFDQGENWIDSQTGFNFFWINTKSLDQNVNSVIMKVKYNGMESDSSSAAEISIVETVPQIMADFCDYLDGHLLKLKFSFSSSNNSPLKQFTISWSENENDKEDFSCPEGEFTFNVIHYYENAGSYDLALSLVQNVNDYSVNLTYLLGTHEISADSKSDAVGESDAVNKAENEFTEDALPIRLNSEDHNFTEKNLDLSKNETRCAANRNSLIALSESQSVTALGLPLQNITALETTALETTAFDLLSLNTFKENQWNEITNGINAENVNSFLFPAENSPLVLALGVESNKIRERSNFALSEKVEKDLSEKSYWYEATFDSSGIFLDHHFLDDLQFDF